MLLIQSKRLKRNSRYANCFSKDVSEKSQAFQDKYDEMMQKLEDTTTTNTSLIQQLVQTIKDTTVEQKGETQRKAPQQNDK